MEAQPFDSSPFAEFAREEDFNARISEAIRTAITREDARRKESGDPVRLIDFEDRTTIALGIPKTEDNGWIVEFEVGGMGQLYSNPPDGTPTKDSAPCVCRGDVRIERAEQTNSLSGAFRAEIREMTVTFEELQRA